MVKKNNYKKIIFIVFFFLLVVTFNIKVIFAEDSDKEYYESELKKNTSASNVEINLKEGGKIKTNYNDMLKAFQDKKNKIMKDDMVSKEKMEQSYKLQTYSYSSNLVNNGNFESGHSYWTEWYKGSDGKWTDYFNFIITAGSGGYDSWYAYISDNDWLISDSYRTSSNVVDFRVSYNYKFFHWGTCSYGLNAVGVYLVDKSTNYSYVIGIHDAEVDPYDYSYVSTNFLVSSRTSLQSISNHDISVEFLHINDDPNCSLVLNLDNVSIEPVIYIPDYIITTSVGSNGTISSGSTVQSGSNFTVNIYPNSGYEISSVLVDGVDVGPVSYYNLNNIQAAHSVQANFNISSSPLNRVYRFWNRIDGRHFYTMSDVEMTGLINNNISEWKYEGVAYKSLSSQLNDSVPLYRFWNKIRGNHFYTTSVVERDGLIANNSDVWNYEGIAYYVYPQGSITADTFVYRFWNKIRGNHFYTTSVVERDGLIANNSDVWNYEGLAWKVDD